MKLLALAACVVSVVAQTTMPSGNLRATTTAQVPSDFLDELIDTRGALVAADAPTTKAAFAPTTTTKSFVQGDIKAPLSTQAPVIKPSAAIFDPYAPPPSPTAGQPPAPPAAQAQVGGSTLVVLDGPRGFSPGPWGPAAWGPSRAWGWGPSPAWGWGPSPWGWGNRGWGNRGWGRGGWGRRGWGHRGYRGGRGHRGHRGGRGHRGHRGGRGRRLDDEEEAFDF